MGEERCVGTQQMELRGTVKSHSKNKLSYQFLSWPSSLRKEIELSVKRL